MVRLRPSTPYMPDEAMLSYVSRLASLHGRTMAQFCFDMGLPLQALVDGDVEVTSRLAAVKVNRPGHIHDDAVRRIDGDDGADTLQEPEREALEALGVGARVRLHADEVRHQVPGPISIPITKVEPLPPWARARG